MANLPDYTIDSFGGGLVTDKGDYSLDKNEFVNTLNLDFENPGKAKRRRGIHQWCQAASEVIDDSYSWYQWPSGGGIPAHHQIAVTRDQTANILRVHCNYLTAAAAVGATTLTVGDNTAFAASGTVEIEGDLVAYTGKSGATGFTGVTGILFAHPAFALVNQFETIATNATLDTRSGVYFAQLNNLLFINGRGGSSGTYDGATYTVVADADRAYGIFATSFRGRIWVAGDGSGVNNGNPSRIAWSDYADATSWDSNNFINVYDNRGEQITGLREGDNALLIFKGTSIWSYDEVNLRQQLWEVGAYCDKVIKKIGNLFYTFCPTGVWETNGFSARKISDPIFDYIKSFVPRYETTNGRVVVNTFAGTYRNKYYLYIGSVTEPETISDVVLVFDTVKRNWTVHSAYTNFVHFASLKSFGDGEHDDAAGRFRPQDIESLFASDSSNNYFKLFDNRYLDNQATRAYRGGDIAENLRANSTGTPTSTILEFGWIDFGSKDWKKIESVMVNIERGNFQISYRLDQGDKKTDWVSLGNFQSGISTKKLRIDNLIGYNLNEGYRIKLKATSNSLEIIDTLNAIIIRGIETMDKIQYAEYDGQR